MSSQSGGIEGRALALGCELALRVIQSWRGDFDHIDALILLAITMANVDGVLFSRELRTRYGGAHPIAPDHLRQPIAASVVALSLGLPRDVVERRIAALVGRGECNLTAEGLIITEDQVERRDRRDVMSAIYELLHVAFDRFDALGLFSVVPLLSSEPVEQQPLRSAPAHAGKYVLRTMDALAFELGDVTDAFVMMGAFAGAGSRPASATGIARAIGLSPRAVRRHIGELERRGFCTRSAHGVMVAENIHDATWFRSLLRKNLDNLFQLFAGLAEVGAVADFKGGRSKA